MTPMEHMEAAIGQLTRKQALDAIAFVITDIRSTSWRDDYTGAEIQHLHAAAHTLLLVTERFHEIDHPHAKPTVEDARRELERIARRKETRLKLVT